MGKSEPSPDQTAARKYRLHFLWCRAGSDIKILGRFSQQQVTNPAANNIGLKPVFLELLDNFCGVWA
jgi:hypothetical protein